MAAQPIFTAPGQGSTYKSHRIEPITPILRQKKSQYQNNP
jgi:hypothetical protein